MSAYLLRFRLLVFLLVVVCFLFVACGDDDDDDSSADDDTAGDDDAIDDDTGTPPDDDQVDDDTDLPDDDAVDDDTVAGDEVEVYEEDGDVVMRNQWVTLRYHLSEGRYSIFNVAGELVIDRAEAVAYSHVLVPKYKWRSSEMPMIDWTAEDENNVLGEGMSLTVNSGGRDESPAMAQTFVLLDGLSCVLAQVKMENTTGKRIKIGSIYPLFTDKENGALLFGGDRDLRVLTNGYVNYLDFVTPLYPGTAPTISNWSTLIHNQNSGDSLSLGFLTFETAQPVIYNSPNLGSGDGQILQAACEYEPAKKVQNEDSLTSETMIFDVGQETPQLALETYADRVKVWLDIETWLERHPDIGVPVGWNSWSGSGSSGGYGTDIDEAIIIDNMDFADRELRRWGMNYFQIDDGWEPAIGDWWVNETRFPTHGDQNGIEWLLSRAENMGFIPGLWIQAFGAEQGSQTLADHPEWFADPLLGGIFGIEDHTLDLTHPGAQDHLVDVMEMLKEWGAEWIKLDFAYRVALSEHWTDSSLTRSEYYRTGVKLVQETLGDDVFFLNVAIVGWNAGLCDALRLTLDTMPAWEGETEYPYVPLLMFENQGLKPMYRDSARRYYLHNRLWINHPDLMFFRAHADPTIPPLTLNESTTFATGVAMQGGIVKIGDRLVDLFPEAVDVIRRIIPPYGQAARPLDVMRSEFPEVWSLAIDEFDEPYHVVGLLNWGLNRDLTQLPYAWIPDEERVIEADLAEAGLSPTATYLAFEFWEQEFLGEVSGELSVEVPARTPRVVALREPLGRPQLVGTNRHVMGGVGVIESVEWNGGDGTLTGVQEGSIGTAHSPFEHRLTFYVPTGYTADEAEVTAPAGFQIENQSLTQDDNVAVLLFTVSEETDGGSIKAQWHPDVTWVVTFD